MIAEDKDVKPNGKKLTRRGKLRRSELLNSAMMLFSEHGYDATTTKAIADHCGVTEAVVFRYFATKRDLFKNVVDHYGPALHYAMPYEELRDRPLGEALAELIRGYLDNSWQHRRSIRIFLLATFTDREIMDMLSRFYIHRQQRLKEMLTERIETNEIRPDVAEHAAEIITLTVTGFLVRALRREPPNFSKARDKFIREMVDVLALGLLSVRS